MQTAGYAMYAHSYLALCRVPKVFFFFFAPLARGTGSQMCSWYW